VEFGLITTKLQFEYHRESFASK